MKLTIAILCVVTVLTMIIYSIIIVKKNKKQKFRISFKEALDLTSLPIITFVSGKTKLNFLLDTGSNSSHIDSKVLHDSNIEYQTINIKHTVIGIEGKEQETTPCILTVKYKDTIFTSEFCITDLSGAFNAIKSEYGVQIHGIIGNEFFQKYKYVIDFQELMCYIK